MAVLLSHQQRALQLVIVLLFFTTCLDQLPFSSWSDTDSVRYGL